MKDSHFKSISDLNHLAHLPNTPYLGMLGTRLLCTSASSFFLQVIDSLPMHAFRRGVTRYDGNRYKKIFSCLDQCLRMTFAQLTHRESLRDIEVYLRAQKDKLYHRGIRGNVSRSAVADAKERRDWRI